MKIEEKNKCKLIVFNIKDFYLSIKETLLIKAKNSAKKLVNITSEDKEIIKHARQSLLCDNSEPWMKKGSGLFDVTMDTDDGEEVCELVGTFVLHKLFLNITKTTLVFIANSLAMFKNISGPKSENFKKDIQKLFKENELDIVIQCNMKTVNYSTLKILLIDLTGR